MPWKTSHPAKKTTLTVFAAIARVNDDGAFCSRSGHPEQLQTTAFWIRSLSLREWAAKRAISKVHPLKIEIQPNGSVPESVDHPELYDATCMVSSSAGLRKSVVHIFEDSIAQH